MNTYPGNGWLNESNGQNEVNNANFYGCGFKWQKVSKPNMNWNALTLDRSQSRSVSIGSNCSIRGYNRQHPKRIRTEKHIMCNWKCLTAVEAQVNWHTSVIVVSTSTSWTSTAKTEARTNEWVSVCHQSRIPPSKCWLSIPTDSRWWRRGMKMTISPSWQPRVELGRWVPPYFSPALLEQIPSQ